MEVNSSGDEALAARRRAIIIESWEEAGLPPVTARLLETIQTRLQRKLGNHDPAGPAAIARVLADEGAELQHPEIIEADAEWRQAVLASNAKQLGLEQLVSDEVMTLATAEMFVARLEELRRQDDGNSDRQALAHLRNIASEARRLAEAIAKNRSAEKSVREEQAEIAEWLKLWLQTPALFKDWLELRRRSDEFRARFTMLNHEDTKTQSE